jgi:hypothetical protein
VRLFFLSFFVKTFILRAINIHTGMLICRVDNDLDGNYSPTTADGVGLGG